MHLAKAEWNDLVAAQGRVLNILKRKKKSPKQTIYECGSLKNWLCDMKNDEYSPVLTLFHNSTRSYIRFLITYSLA
jgi:hypothetical protein